MKLLYSTVLFVCFVAHLVAQEKSYKDKRAAEWTEAESMMVLTESDWTKTTTPKVNMPVQVQRGGGGGRGGNIGIGGVGMPRRGGRGGRNGGGFPDEGRPRAGGRTIEPPVLTIRWESALPVQQAELLTKDNSGPSLDDDHYAISILGLPRRIMGNDPDELAKQLKGHASLKREGKKPIKPTEVRVIPRDEGLVVVFFFSRMEEITRNDKHIEFDATIAPFEVKQSFEPNEMMYLGKLEL